MSGVKLVVKHAFGINANVKQNLTFCDEHLLAYVCGHQVVIFNTESRDQSFIALTSLPGLQSQGITTIGCAIRRKWIAVAEKADPVAVVSFYDTHALRRRKQLSYPELDSKEIRCIAFSDDNRFCLTLGAGPGWNLVLWNVEKAPKVLSMVKLSPGDETPFHQISFCSYENTTVVAIGKGAIRAFRIGDGQFRPINISFRRDSANFVSHCWLYDDEKLIVSTEAGEILMFENLEYRAQLFPTGEEVPEDIRSVLCLTPTTRGFAMGTTLGEIRFFEKNPDPKAQNPFIVEDAFRIPPTSSGSAVTANVPGGVNVVSIVMGPDESVVCATSAQQVLTFSMSQIKNIKEGIASLVGGLEYLVTSFHGPNRDGEAAITGIDVALWRPVAVTCGSDKTVRMWNYNERKLLLSKDLDDEPMCLSVHPSGLFIAVGFASKIDVFSVLMDDLEVTHSFICRNCTYIKYSHGGHMLASAHGSNIQVYNVAQHSLICCLRGHTNKVCELVWMHFDARLMSVGVDGTVHFWDIYPSQCRPEHYTGRSGTIFVAGCGTRDGTKAYVVNPEKQVKEITFARSTDAGSSQEVVAISESEELDYGAAIGRMWLDDSRKMVIMCTNEAGMPGSMMFVLASPQLSHAYDLMTVHGAPITAICQSHNGMMIFTGDAQGCLCMSEFDTEPGGFSSHGKVRDSLSNYDFQDEILVHRADVESKKTQIKELSFQVSELTQNNEYQMRTKEIEFLDLTKKTHDRHANQMSVATEKYNDLLEDKRRMERDFQMKIDALGRKFTDELVAADLKAKQKVSTEESRHMLLLKETEEMNRQWDEENRGLVDSHQAYMREMTHVYEEKLRSEQSQQKEAHTAKEKLQMERNASRANVELDADLEVAGLKVKQEERLRQEEELGVELTAQHALLKKNLKTLQSEVDHQKEETKKLREKEARLLETIRNLEKDILGHKKEIREREETISDKEKRIFDLKKKNQELEKFRFVLDYKIKELKLQIAPREAEIATMRKQVEEMNLELEQYHKSNLALNLMIEELKLKLEGLRRELLSQKERAAMNDRVMEKYKRDLQEVYFVRDQPDLLKQQFLNIYRTYVQEELSVASAHRSAGSGEDPQVAYNRDREMLERSLEGLRRTLKADINSRKRDGSKLTREGVLLTKELNMLRKEAGELRTQCKFIENAGAINTKMDPVKLMELMNQLSLALPKKASLGVSGGAAAGGKTTRGKSGKGGLEASHQSSISLYDGAPTGPVGPGPGPGHGPGPDLLGLSDSIDSLNRDKVTMQRSSSYTRSAAPSTFHQRTIALRTTSAGGRSDQPAPSGKDKAKKQRTDQWEALREVQMQSEQMRNLEGVLGTLCSMCGIDAGHLLESIDASLAMS